MSKPASSALQPGELLSIRTRNALYALAMFNAVVISVTWPLTALLAEMLHVTGAAQGWLFALQSIGAMVSATWTGSLCDRLGKRAVIVSHLALLAVGWLAAGLHLSFTTVAAATFLTGVSSASLTAISAYFGAHTEPGVRSRVFAHMLAMRGIGQVAGPALLAMALVFDMSTIGLVLAAGGVAVMAGAFFVQDSRTKASSDAAPKHRTWLPRVPAAVVLPLLAMGLLWTSPGSVSNYVPIHAKASLGAGAQGLSLLFSLLGLTMVLAPGVLWLLERCTSERNAARGSYALMALAIVAISLATSLPWLIAGYIVWALMWDVAYPYVKAEMSRRAKPEEQASVQAAEQFVTGALMSIVTPIAGALYAGQGADSVFIGAAALAALGTLVLFVAMASRKATAPAAARG